MELKQHKFRTQVQVHPLLIVPYGIETTDHVYNSPEITLLIVPYGIETWERSNPSTFNVDF